MIRPFLVAASLSIVSAATATAQHHSHAFPIAQEVERLATAHSFWPGYDPIAIPLAIFDGRQTYLFRHPAPPEGFVPATGAQPRAHVYEGRHAAVIANSSADIGGVSTATVIADGPRAELPPARLAAVALHEAFHVFQRRKHPAWVGNEADLLLYPIDDARLLALRRLETESLRRALASPDSSGSACWAARALTFRRERFSGLDSAFSTYEPAYGRECTPSGRRSRCCSMAWPQTGKHHLRRTTGRRWTGCSRSLSIAKLQRTDVRSRPPSSRGSTASRATTLRRS